MAPFAHIMGTVKGGIESLPGTEGSSDFGRDSAANTYSRSACGNILVQFKNDPATEPLRSFLLATVQSCQELYSTVRRLGLPETSVRNKLPWFRYTSGYLLLCFYCRAFVNLCAWCLCLLHCCSTMSQHMMCHVFDAPCRGAMAEPDKAVVLSLHQRQMLAALSSGALESKDVNYRPKPHFRTHAPGIRTVIAANVLLVWLVCTVQL